MKNEQIEKAIGRVLEGRGVPPAEPCPDESRIAAYLDSRLEPEEHFAFEAHAARCSTCQEILALSLRLDGEPPEREAILPEPSKKVIFHITVPVSALALVFVAALIGMFYYSLARREIKVPPVTETAELRAPAAIPDSVPTPPAAPPIAPAKPKAENVVAKQVGHSARELEQVAEKSAAPTPPAAAAAAPALDESVAFRAVEAKSGAATHLPAATPAASEGRMRMTAMQSLKDSAEQAVPLGEKRIGDRTFTREGDKWVDGECAKSRDAAPVEIRPDSEEYMEILKTYPGLQNLRPVIICWKEQKRLLR